MSTTLIDELEQAATRAAVRAQETDERTAGVRWQHLRGIHEAEASRLRQRAARVRELFAPGWEDRHNLMGLTVSVLSLLGPDIPAAAPSPETGTVAGPMTLVDASDVADPGPAPEPVKPPDGASETKETDR